MIILGFLSYHDGYLKIPNKELMKEFEKAFILELKKDEDVDVAINQIKSKEYVQKFIEENKNRKVLAVAICYNSKEKEHYKKTSRLYEV